MSRPLRKAKSAAALKGTPPVNPAVRLELQVLQRAADLEFALRETQAALSKVIHHVTTEAPSDASRLGMCHAAAEEGLLRADSALGTLPARRRAGDRPAKSNPIWIGDWSCAAAGPTRADIIREEVCAEIKARHHA
jgi:hypothetical protein